MTFFLFYIDIIVKNDLYIYRKNGFDTEDKIPLIFTQNLKTSVSLKIYEI